MEGEMETAEETKEEEELHHHFAMVSSKENFPIMHWEALSERIAELEKQEEESRERRGMGESRGTDWTDFWDEDEEDFRKCRLSVSSPRFNNRNLQMCFINDGNSEDDEEETKTQVSMGTGPIVCRGAGLKQEVVTALRMLRDKLLAQQKEQEEQPSSSCVSERKHLERWNLLEHSVQQLMALRATLHQEVHALSSELVAQLLVRDQLRTKQDAMLLDVQDLT